ncbi:hypothetical protein [Treponema sp. SP13]|uniref:hypothetical protein n=1 Tax=Treponema sp. SP13 TaxID=2789742 RepID=UPI003D94080B
MPSTHDPSVRRTIRYGVLNARYKNTPVDISTVFTEIDKLSFSNDDRYLAMSDGVRLEVLLNRPSMPIRGMIGDSRMKELPMIETKGKLDKLNLRRGSGLFDATHFVIINNKNNIPIIGYEYNIRAPRINRLQEYILIKFPEVVDFFAIEPINDKDINKVLKEIQEPTKFTIKAHNSCSMLDLDKNLADVFSSARKVSNCDYITIGFSRKRGRKEPIDFANYNNIAGFIGSHNASLIESFKITYKNAQGENEDIELLDLFLHDKASVPTLTEDSRFVDSQKLYEIINSYIMKRKVILDGIKI